MKKERSEETIIQSIIQFKLACTLDSLLLYWEITRGPPSSGRAYQWETTLQAVFLPDWLIWQYPEHHSPEKIGHCADWPRPSKRGAREYLKIIGESGCPSKVWDNFFLIGWKQHLLRGGFWLRRGQSQVKGRVKGESLVVGRRPIFKELPL